MWPTVPIVVQDIFKVYFIKAELVANIQFRKIHLWSDEFGVACFSLSVTVAMLPGNLS